ncbi:MAG TPA: cupin domain-containing protein [Planktothrix sp.]|jgi:mannose-6-phosphate isomerase-like protein (cupin superfamily)
MEKLQTKTGNVTLGNVGRLDEQVSKEQVKYFLHDFLGLTGMEVSITGYPPNHAFHLFHSHIENEELYIVTRGEGEMQLDDEIFPIKEGTVIRVEPNVVRNLRSSPSSGLQFVCVQARMNSLKQFNTPDVKFVERQFAENKE